MKATATRPQGDRYIKFASSRYFGLDGHYRTNDVCLVGRDISEDNALIALGERRAYDIDTPEDERPGNEEIDCVPAVDEVDRDALMEEAKAQRGEAFFSYLNAVARHEMVRGLAFAAVAVVLLVKGLQIAEDGDQWVIAQKHQNVAQVAVNIRPLRFPTRAEQTMVNALRDTGHPELLPYAYTLAEGK